LPSSIPFAIPPALPLRFSDSNSNAASAAVAGSLPPELIMRNHESLLSMLKAGQLEVTFVFNVFFFSVLLMFSTGCRNKGAIETMPARTVRDSYKAGIGG
jgi:hypothetical protein